MRGQPGTFLAGLARRLTKIKITGLENLAILDQPGPASAAFNFGPGLDSNRTVAELVEELLIHWPGRWENKSDPSAPHEASKLNLATDKAFHLLGWKPRWNFTTSIARTADWYKVTSGSTVAADFQTITRQHIKEYQES